MFDRKYLGITDYIVICSSLLISVGIGIASRLLSSEQKTTKEYILAGKKMSRLPVILSILVTFVSPTTMLAVPAEIYKYGIGFITLPFGLSIGVLLASWVFIPVYFQCGVSTIYEFLEMRFGKIIRFIISTLFLVQMMFYMVTCLTQQISVLPMFIVFIANNLFGLVLYSIYYKCDPILNKDQTGLDRYDQIVPAYIVNTFSWIPGMTGLCIAGLFSAALSTISSCLNSIASVTVIDIIKPLYRRGNMSEIQVVWCAKILSLVYGGLCVGLSFCFMEVRSLLQLMNVMVSSLEGPMLAIFAVGVLTTKASDKCVSFALIVGYSLISCLSFGTLFSEYTHPTLPLSTDDCYHQF
ncbi:putative sodium-dependent multivitamin transporter [Parasteatoda tepidariorum]|uniref:putative sodium-dependent multivitamin transporter n=1 Tax=Parasteatoda tepidariorum TaxID=114398 RepID=UPI0039BD62E7